MAAIFTQSPAQKQFAVKEYGADLLERYGQTNTFMLSLADIIRELENILSEDDDLPDDFRSDIEQYLESL